MILAENAEGRRKALAKILPYQQADFKGIFKAMEGCPVTVRLLDPPLHEFVPHDLKGQQEMADTMGVSLQYIQQRVEALCEHNPMLGHRGCRLGNTYPEITQMQTRAILGAALELKKEGVETHPEIMVPLTGILYEFKQQEEVIRAEAAQLFEEVGDSIDFKVGTMIEIPHCFLCRVLLIRYERLDSDDIWLFTRRYRFLPPDLSGEEDSESRPVPGTRPEWCRTVGAHGY